MSTPNIVDVRSIIFVSCGPDDEEILTCASGCQGQECAEEIRTDKMLCVLPGP